MAYQTAAQLRAAVPALESEAKFSDTVLADLVSEFEGIAERYRGVAYETRSVTDTILVDDACTWLRLTWPKVSAISSVTVTSPAVGGTEETVTSTDYTYDGDTGHLYYPTGFAAGDKVVVAYSHGTSQPGGLVRACREYVRAEAVTDRSGVPRDVIAQSFDGGYTRFSTADWNAGRPTGWLYVDRILNSFDDYRHIL